MSGEGQNENEELQLEEEEEEEQHPRRIHLVVEDGTMQVPLGTLHSYGQWKVADPRPVTPPDDETTAIQKEGEMEGITPIERRSAASSTAGDEEEEEEEENGQRTNNLEEQMIDEMNGVKKTTSPMKQKQQLTAAAATTSVEGRRKLSVQEKDDTEGNTSYFLGCVERAKKLSQDLKNTDSLSLAEEKSKNKEKSKKKSQTAALGKIQILDISPEEFEYRPTKLREERRRQIAKMKLPHLVPVMKSKEMNDKDWDEVIDASIASEEKYHEEHQGLSSFKNDGNKNNNVVLPVGGTGHLLVKTSTDNSNELSISAQSNSYQNRPTVEEELEMLRFRQEKWFTNLAALLSFMKILDIRELFRARRNLSEYLSPVIVRKAIVWKQRALRQKYTQQRDQAGFFHPLLPEVLRKTNDYFIDWYPQNLAEFISKLKKISFRAGEYVFHAGDRGLSAMYLIANGAVEVIVINERNGAGKRKSKGKDNGNVVANLAKGRHFGDCAVLTGDPRCASIRCSEDTDLWMISKEDYRVASATLPEIMHQRFLRMANEKRLSNIRTSLKITVPTLRAHPCFECWHIAGLQDFVDELEPQIFRKEEIVATPKDNDYKFYYVISGEITLEEPTPVTAPTSKEASFAGGKKKQQQGGSRSTERMQISDSDVVNMTAGSSSDDPGLYSTPASFRVMQQYHNQKRKRVSLDSEPMSVSSTLMPQQLPAGGKIFNLISEGTGTMPPAGGDTIIFDNVEAAMSTSVLDEVMPQFLKISKLKDVISVGGFFGEIETIFGEPRIYTATVTKGPCEVWVLTRAKYLQICKIYAPHAVETREILNDLRAQVIPKPFLPPKALYTDSVLHYCCPKEILEEIWFKSAKAKLFPQGENMFLEGDRASNVLYLVVSGSFVIRYGKEMQRLSQRLSPNASENMIRCRYPPTSEMSGGAGGRSPTGQEGLPRSSSYSMVLAEIGSDAEHLDENTEYLGEMTSSPYGETTATDDTPSPLPEHQYILVEDLPTRSTLLGSMEFALGSKTFLFNVRCTSPCVVWTLSRPMLEEIISKQHPAIWNSIHSSLSIDKVISHFLANSLRSLQYDEAAPRLAEQTKATRRQQAASLAMERRMRDKNNNARMAANRSWKKM